MRRNLTLSLDEDVLYKARIACQKRKTTLTKFVRGQLENLVHHDEQYQEAMNRIIDLIKKRPDVARPFVRTQEHGYSCV